MRIISGDAKGRTLFAPQGAETRPTSDKLRGSIFNILGGRVADARVLDLFGGTGALALEALSRGAKSAVLVDCGARACPVIQDNIDTLGCGDRARLLRMKDTAAIAALNRQGAAFDLIFLDPPYRMDTAPVCAALIREGLLEEGGLIVAEHARETPPSVPPPLLLLDRREYGVTGLSFYHIPKEETP